MPTTRAKNEEIEPVGIVISRGSQDEPIPAVFAYVWGPAPDAPPVQPPHRAPRRAPCAA